MKEAPASTPTRRDHIATATGGRGAQPKSLYSSAPQTVYSKGLEPPSSVVGCEINDVCRFYLISLIYSTTPPLSTLPPPPRTERALLMEVSEWGFV